MRLRPPLLVSLLLFACFGCTSDPSGTYEGTISTSCDLSIPEGPGVINAHAASDSFDGQVILRKLSDELVEVTLPSGCVLQFKMEDENSAEISHSTQQTCPLQEGPYDGPVNVDGDIDFNGEGMELRLVGALPQPSDTAGSWGYSFSGQKNAAGP